MDYRSASESIQYQWYLNEFDFISLTREFHSLLEEKSELENEILWDNQNEEILPFPFEKWLENEEIREFEEEKQWKLDFNKIKKEEKSLIEMEAFLESAKLKIIQRFSEQNRGEEENFKEFLEEMEKLKKEKNRIHQGIEIKENEIQKNQTEIMKE